MFSIYVVYYCFQRKIQFCFMYFIAPVSSFYAPLLFTRFLCCPLCGSVEIRFYVNYGCVTYIFLYSLVWSFRLFSGDKNCVRTYILQMTTFKLLMLILLQIGWSEILKRFAVRCRLSSKRNWQFKTLFAASKELIKT